MQRRFFPAIVFFLPMTLSRRIRRSFLLPALLIALALLTFRHNSPLASDWPLDGTLSEYRPSSSSLFGKKSGQDATSAPYLKSSSFPSHYFRQDGLLVVNPDGRHPIYDLVERGEAMWKAKLGRASTSYDQLVAEYRRRYDRSPPPGLDQWWAYVQEHDVQLPDEYDQIYYDLEPFWGIKPSELRKIQAELEDHENTFTLSKAEGEPLRILTEKLPADSSKRENLLGPATEMLQLLEGVQHLLPPFRAVFSPFGVAEIFLHYNTKSYATKAAATDLMLDMKDLPRSRKRGWTTGCPPSSPAITQELYSPKDAKSFIYDHRTAMDPCKHPSLLQEHGQFIAHGIGPHGTQKLPPLFSYTTSSLHSDIHVTPPSPWVEDIYPREADPEFEQKDNNQLSWRGANSGIRQDGDKEWWLSQRNRLVTWANEQNGTAVVLPTHVSASRRVGTGDEVNKADLSVFFDVAFSGHPLACGTEECNEIEKKYEWREPYSTTEAGRYKYVFDVDGNGRSSRFQRLMTSNSLVFKATVYPEWFTDRVEPWVHYIPVKYDFSDLYDSLTFFRGDVLGEGSHEEMASKIAKAGREWSKAFWRKEDMAAYMLRLLLEYARLMRDDRVSDRGIER
ncbi:hypothetical protein ID866_4233 [Astraeus odoratus]|nr:hypothetical protein ID866_4233 [Astraeus odoratus]